MRRHTKTLEDHAQTRPNGLTRDELNSPLTSNNGDDTAIFAALVPKIAALRGRWATWYWRDPTFDTEWLKAHGHDVYLRHLSGCTVNEIAQYSHALTFSGRFTNEFENMPHLYWFRKIRNAAWRWGVCRLTWNQVVDFHEVLMAFDFDLPDFEVRYDHTRGCNERGTTCYTVNAAATESTWLDGVFGLIVRYKGQHVLTVSVSPTEYGLTVHQVQLKNPKGNRWMYTLPCSVLEYVLLRLQAACNVLPTPMPLHLIDADSLVEFIRGVYGAKLPADWNDTCAPRIRATYSQSLTKFVRGPKFYVGNRCEFNAIYALEV